MKAWMPTRAQAAWRRGVRSAGWGSGRPARRLARRVPVKREGVWETRERVLRWAGRGRVEMGVLLMVIEPALGV